MEFIQPLLDSGQPAWLVTSFIALFLLRQLLSLLKEHVSTFKSIRGAIHHTPKNIEAMAAAEAEASKEMKAIAMDYGADRVGISLFHNGTHSLQNIHFLKVSAMVEGLSGRVGGILPVSQNRLVAEYGDFGRRLIANKEFIKLTSLDQLPSDMKSFADFLTIYLVRSLHILPLFVDDNGKQVVDGCLYIHHCVDNCELTDHQLTEIQARAQAVYNELSKANGVKDGV